MEYGQGLGANKLAFGLKKKMTKGGEHELAMGIAEHLMSSKNLKGSGMVAGNIFHTIGNIASFFGMGMKKKTVTHTKPRATSAKPKPRAASAKKPAAKKRTMRGGMASSLLLKE